MFCADLPAEVAAPMAASQRPLSAAALAEKATVAAFVVAAGVALLALLIGIVTIRVSRQDLADAGSEPQEPAPQPATVQQQDDQAALAAAARPCRLC
jgi:hypothetical protein